MKISSAEYSKIKRMTITQLSTWITTFYQSAWNDGYNTAAKEICNQHEALQIVTTDWIEENCGTDVLNKIMEGVELE